MISIRKQNYGLDVALFNEFTLSDFQEFEQAALEIVKEIHRPDLLLDLSMLKDFTIDMAIEQFKFSREHDSDFGRIAIVVDNVWIKMAASIVSLMTQTHPKYFDDIEVALAWLQS